MKVRLRTTMAGAKGVFASGSVVDLPETAALHLLRTKQAEEYVEEKPAAIGAPESEEFPPRRRRKNG